MKKANARVPHQQIDLQPVHITYRLAGSLPKAVLNQLRAKHELQKAELEATSRKNPKMLSSGIYKHELFAINARYELEIDQALHSIADGPFYLSDPRLAKEIIDSWKFLHYNEDVYVYAVCVMGNHVHALVRAPEGKDEVDIGSLMNRHKSHTARICNKLIGKTRTQFWEHFYFDRTVRRGKFNRVMWYVLNNPVEAKLVSTWTEWTGTYLNPEFGLLFRIG